MKLTKKLLPLAVSAAVAAPMLFGATVAQAEVSATLGAANMYLWRGQNLTPDAPQISGSLDYSHASGFYAGAWMTNEDDGHETDLYLGYGGSIGDFGYDISYWKYLYPEEGRSDSATPAPVGLSDSDLSDIVISLSYGPVAFTAYLGAESGTTKDDYYTLSGEMGKFSALYGSYVGDGANDGSDYQHIQLGYAFNDNVSFAVSKASDDGAGVEEDPLFVVSYSKTFDM